MHLTDTIFELLGENADTTPRLLDKKAQEKYYTKIVDRYMSFCSDAGKRDE